MAQQREAPAYQEYAAAMMARREYRTISLAARGLLYSLRLECWVNRSVPADPLMLSRVLGFQRDEVESALNEIMVFLVLDGENLVFRDLEDYRTHIASIRQKQAAGGKKGAEKTNSIRSGSLSGNSSGNSRFGRQGTCESVDQFNSVQSNPVKPLAMVESPSTSTGEEGGGA